MTAPTALFGLPHCRETDVYSAAEGRERKAAAWLPEQTSDRNVITEWMDKVSVLSIGAYGLGCREELEIGVEREAKKKRMCDRVKEQQWLNVKKLSS